MLVSDSQSRDIKMDQFTSSFHGRLLNEGAEISLNYGNRYGLLGENGSGKVGVFVTAQISAANYALSSRPSSNLSPNGI